MILRKSDGLFAFLLGFAAFFHWPDAKPPCAGLELETCALRAQELKALRDRIQALESEARIRRSICNSKDDQLLERIVRIEQKLEGAPAIEVRPGATMSMWLTLHEGRYILTRVEAVDR